MKISVVVTNWNGLLLLQKNLPQVIAASPEAQEIIVADDASTDESCSYISQLQKKYSRLKLIKNKINLGFGPNSNQAVNRAQGDLIVLLNNDISPRSGYIPKTLPLFKDPRLLGVGFAEIGNQNWGKIYWRYGYLQYQPGLPTSQPHITAWLNGGSCIVNKKIFTRLNGFDPIYHPFYFEDLDLGLRAWKSGFRLLWHPQSEVCHQHQATISKFSKRFLTYVKERNHLLLIWRNITDTKLLRAHRWAQLGRVLSGPNYLKIIRAARRQTKKFPPPIVFPQLSDRQLLNLFT